jgi:CYTH domain-containing protein/predicted ATPase
MKGNSMKQIYRFCITGGPCAGKSTGMSKIRSKLHDLGYLVITVPEMATELISSGITPNGSTSFYEFQECIMEGQLAREQAYLTFAEKVMNQKVVILFDRGLKDNKAYCKESEWIDLLEQFNLSDTAINCRYDAIIHLRTAAFGEDDSYTTINNSARKETKEEARALCEKTLNAWNGHPHLHVIENQNSFEHKMAHVVGVILHHLGEPEPLEIEKKFVVDSSFCLEKIPVNYVVSSIEQHYLSDKSRVRSRTEGGVSVYTRTWKHSTGRKGVRIEREENITGREYRMLKNEAISSLHKKRVCFVYDHQYFELDFFEKEYACAQKNGALILLEIELTSIDTKVRIPPWLPVIEEVTGDNEYDNIQLSLPLN